MTHTKLWLYAFSRLSLASCSCIYQAGKEEYKGHVKAAKLAIGGGCCFFSKVYASLHGYNQTFHIHIGST